MSYNDIKELSNYLRLTQRSKSENIITYGDPGSEFYIILKGLVGVQIPNPKVKEWKLKRRDYQSLLEWKHSYFDPKVAIAKKIAHERYLLEFNERENAKKKIAMEVNSPLAAPLKNGVGSPY